MNSLQQEHKLCENECSTQKSMKFKTVMNAAQNKFVNIKYCEAAFVCGFQLNVFLA